MKKHAYKNYFFHSIKHDLSRILSIIAIVALGVGFLIGLLSSAPNLRKSVNLYIKENHVNDIFIKSSVGFDEESIDEITKQIQDIQKKDLKTELEANGLNQSTRLYSRIVYQNMESDSLNQVVLQEGRFPQRENECLQLIGNPTLSHMNIGEEIRFTLDNQTLDYTIVGNVYDPYYLAKEDIFSFSSGRKIQSVFYLDQNYTKPSITTDLCLSFTTLEKENVFTNAYEKKVQEIVKEIEFILESNQWASKNYRAILETKVKDETIKMLKENGLNDETIESIINTPNVINQMKEEVDQQFETTYVKMEPTFYVLTQESIASISGFSINASKVDLIASIFPVFFFAIAMLVSLSSFTRIVSKDRVEIGTFKALGYPNSKIYQKYLLIGLFSVIIGCILGAAGGIFILPYILYRVYKAYYLLPTLQYTFQYLYIFGVSILMIGLILLIIYYVVHRLIKKTAAELLVDNTIKPGKTILLEKIPWIWNKLKFKYKSMFRNVFRFKKNLWMMILGVGGCAAILLTGLGLNDSLNVLTKNQYQDIFQYNLIIETSRETIDGIDKQINISYFENGTINDDDTFKTSLVIGKEDLNEYITFTNLKGKEITFEKDSCFITKQIAKELKLKVNSTFIYEFNQKKYELKVSNIVQNYVGNYIYLGDSYSKSLGIDKTNAIMANHDIPKEEENSWYENLLEDETIKNVISTNQYYETYTSLIDNLKGVVAILVIISGLLAIIVIYNLVDINVNERVKEMATLRVIGYQKREVILYIFREVFIMSLLGFMVGILFGVFLHQFIIQSISSPGLIFGTFIQPLSYVYTGLLTVFFSLIVVIIFSPKILKINMAEALKSSE